MSKVDVYSFISSQVIREYFRRNREFTTIEKVRIILSSWIPMPEKLEALKLLKEEVEGEDLKILDYIEPLYSKLFQCIESPDSSKHLFAGRGLAKNSDMDLLQLSEDCLSYYKTPQEVINDWLGGQEPELIDIDCVYFGEECQWLYKFIVVVKDEEYEVTHIIPNEEVYANGEYEINLLDDVMHGSDRYSLPFKFGEKVKIVLPYLGLYDTGHIESSMDVNGCWYHFFYSDKNKNKKYHFTDLSYFWLDTFNEKFNVFDCIYEIDGSIQEGLKVDSLSPDRKIKDIVGDGRRYGFTAHLIEILGWDNTEPPMMEVKLQDDTGCIRGYIAVNDNDYKWLYDAMNNNEELFIEGGFEKHADGEVYMDYSIGVTRL